MSAPRKLPRDHAVRTRAATDFETNLVVSAGAGTGKTTLLVERVLVAIGRGVADLPAIAAITFTEKAAGELRHRLAVGLRQLRKIASSGSDGADDASAAMSAFARLTIDAGVDRASIAARAANAEAGLDRATVTTVHGFCSDILRAYPLAANLPPAYTIDRGLTGRRFAALEWTAFVEHELGPSAPRAALWERVLRVLDLGTLEQIGRVLAGGAISESMLGSVPAAIDLGAVLGSAAQRLANEIREAIDRTDGLTDTPRKWLTEASRTLDTLARDGAQAARTTMEGSTRLHREMGDVHTAKVAEADADALDALAKRIKPYLKALASYDPRVEADLFETLLPFARRLRARQTRSAIVDFDGLLVRARDLLRDELPVREALKRRYRLILVDEFQDTDPVQYEIVFLLAEQSDSAAHDAYATTLAPGRLFIVGDAKQSIYRFRGADYAAYRKAVRHVLDQGGEELTLSANFRSTPSVLGPVNALFAEPGSVLWRRSDYLPPYETIHAEREDDDAAAVEVWTTTAGPDATAPERRRAEGLALAVEIRNFAGPGREWRYEDVLVLFRGFSDLSPYLRALREAAIPFVVSGGRTFFERTEIVQAMAVLRAVASPDDPIALLAYRRSPAGGVPDTELFAAATGTGDDVPNLAAADARLAALRTETKELPADVAVRRILEESGLLVLSGLAFEGAQRVANLEKLQTAASELARDGRRTLLETLDALEEGFESDEEGDSPLADESRDAIRVMSIHKAKGLEARVVILADTAAGRVNRPPKDASARIARFDQGEFIRVDGPDFRSGAAIAATIDEPQHKEAEDVRLLYVALTRARDRLFVFGDCKPKTPWSEAIAGWTSGVTHRIAGDAERRPGSTDRSPIGAPDAVARFEAAATSALALAAPPFRSPSDAGARVEPQPAIHGALAPDIARAVGVIVHARLAGVTPQDTGEAYEEAARVFSAFESSPLGARRAALTVLGREVPMLFHEEHARWNGAIDLLYRDADGAIVVADYKTDTTDDGAIARHGEQLGVYVRAVQRAMPGERVRAELWMVRTGRVIEV